MFWVHSVSVSIKAYPLPGAQVPWVSLSPAGPHELRRGAWTAIVLEKKQFTEGSWFQVDLCDKVKDRAENETAPDARCSEVGGWAVSCQSGSL